MDNDETVTTCNCSADSACCQPAPSPCPHCGYCPTCGRRNYFPYFQHYPPYWPYTTPYVYCGTYNQTVSDLGDVTIGQSGPDTLVFY